MAVGEMMEAPTVARWSDTGVDPGAFGRPVVGLVGGLALALLELANHDEVSALLYWAGGLLAARWLLWVLRHRHAPAPVTLELELDRLRLTRGGQSTDIARADVATVRRIGSRSSWSGTGSGICCLDASGRELLRLRPAEVTVKGPLVPPDDPWSFREGCLLDDLLARWWMAATPAELAAGLAPNRRLEDDPSVVLKYGRASFGIGIVLMVGVPIYRALRFGQTDPGYVLPAELIGSGLAVIGVLMLRAAAHVGGAERTL